MQIKIITTADGSHSLYIPELNEHYHSTHGAIQESKHVFIEAGLKHVAKKTSDIFVFEVGLGTGLNALLTYLESQSSGLKIKYTAIEAFPLEKEITEELNYVHLLDTENSAADVFRKMHSCDWEKEHRFSDSFLFKKIKKSLQEIVPEKERYDLVYFDAFGPPVQPEMWTEDLFSKLFAALKPNGALVTYCAKGEVKRTLKKVGFIVESLPGPPGKREMIRALKM